MKVVIPQWQDRVSPVFDSASKALVVEVEKEKAGPREVTFIGGENPLERVRLLQRLGAHVLICGAISRPMEVALIAAGIRVIPDTCGAVEEVLNAFLCGRLSDKTFKMPGTGRRKGGLA